MQDFTVPTLSLSSSRAKRQHNNSVPTRDFGQKSSSYTHQSSLPANYEVKYMNYEQYQPQEPADKIKRTHIFPPRNPNVTMEVPPKDLSKNVYLQSPEGRSHSPSSVQFSYQNVQTRQYEQNPPPYQQIQHSSSRRGLFTNVDNSKIIQE